MFIFVAEHTSWRHSLDRAGLTGCLSCRNLSSPAGCLAGWLFGWLVDCLFAYLSRHTLACARFVAHCFCCCAYLIAGNDENAGVQQVYISAATTTAANTNANHNAGCQLHCYAFAHIHTSINNMMALTFIWLRLGSGSIVKIHFI